jgi:hypothetical protein
VVDELSPRPKAEPGVPAAMLVLNAQEMVGIE